MIHRITHLSLLFTLLVLSGLVHAAPQKTVVRYIKPFTNINNQNNYFEQVLQKVCEVTQADYGPCELVPVDLPMMQQRQLNSLQNNVIDVLWTVSTPEREAASIAIKFPLMKGLIGYRIAVYRSAVDYAFQPNQPVNKIKSLNVVQGHDWPDANILKNNGFTLDSSSWSEASFRETSRGIHDYMLRGVLEISSEQELYDKYALTVDQNHLFVYPSNMYFFVGKGKDRLAERLQKGLARLESSGEFNDLLRHHPAHQQAIKLLKLSSRTIHSLINNGQQLSEEEIAAVISSLEEP